MAGASPPAHEFHVAGRTHGDLDMATRPCLPAAIAISMVLEAAMLPIFAIMASINEEAGTRARYSARPRRAGPGIGTGLEL